VNTDRVYGSPNGEERRRAIRRRVDDQIAAMPVVAPVQVIDISRAGVLFATDYAFTPGDTGTLCVDINGSSFKAAIQVLRIAPPRTGSHRHQVGATFLSPGPEHDLLLRHI
jgi:hypothetical protein